MNEAAQLEPRPTAAHDRYPSRCGRPAAILPRLDPVVYATPAAASPLERSLLARYQRDGFLILPGFFDDARVAALQAELEVLRSDQSLAGQDNVICEPGSGELRSIFAIHTVSPVFAALASDPRLAGLATYLLGDDTYLHQTRLNYKPGLRGREFYWHSDFETWHVEDGMPAMRALSVSVTLGDNRAENGALMLVPGSHQRYVRCVGDTPENHFRQSLRRQEYGVPGDAELRELVDQGGIVSATGKAGTVVIFDCNTMHGSNGNITPWPRANAFFVYNAVCNRLQAPFSGQPPRPEYIAAREPDGLPAAARETSR